jgi:hypothetical protein
MPTLPSSRLSRVLASSSSSSAAACKAVANPELTQGKRGDEIGMDSWRLPSIHLVRSGGGSRSVVRRRPRPRLSLGAGHVGQRHGGVELDVAGDAPAALPLPVAVVRHGSRAGVLRASYSRCPCIDGSERDGS